MGYKYLTSTTFDWTNVVDVFFESIEAIWFTDLNCLMSYTKKVICRLYVYVWHDMVYKMEWKRHCCEIDKIWNVFFFRSWKGRKSIMHTFPVRKLEVFSTTGRIPSIVVFEGVKWLTNNNNNCIGSTITLNNTIQSQSIDSKFIYVRGWNIKIYLFIEFYSHAAINFGVNS